MKIVLENGALNLDKYSKEEKFAALMYFNDILSVVENSKGQEDVLRANMPMAFTDYNMSGYPRLDSMFMYGFGGTHMWMVQKIDLSRRVLLVEL